MKTEQSTVGLVLTGFFFPNPLELEIMLNSGLCSFNKDAFVTNAFVQYASLFLGTGCPHANDII